MVKELSLLLLALLMVGCSPLGSPNNAGQGKSQPVQPTPPGAPAEAPPLPPPDPAPSVAAVTVTGATGEVRYTPDAATQSLTLTGPLQLRVEVENPAARMQTEWYFEGFLNQMPGPIPNTPSFLQLGTGRQIEWNPGPGSQGRLWVVVWGDGSQAGRPGWRSWDLHVRYPTAESTVCPAIALPRPPANEENAADLGQTVIDREMNQLIISRLGERFLIPLSADPDSCVDPLIAARLRAAQGPGGR